MKKKVTQPDAAAERELDSIIRDGADFAELRGRRVKVRWLGYFAIRKLSEVMVDSKDERSVACKCAAAIRLNGYWGIRLWWWALWRWYFYVRQYSEAELLPLIELSKKKVPLETYLTATIYLTAMKDTVMQMTRKEAETILRGRYGEASGS